MVRVAIAGGTGGLGRTIVDSIVSTKLHEVFILSRFPSSSSPPISPNPTITHLQIDYTSPTTIGSVLKKHEIDTIISALHMNGPESAEAQLNLIQGADIAGCVKRFVPSEFGFDYLEAEKKNFPFPGLEFKVSAIAALHATSLQYTRLMSGTFMDYLLPSSPSNISTLALFLDFANGKAVIPGDGNGKVVFTHTSDIGGFVAVLLGRQTWLEASYTVGSCLSLNEIVGIAESVSGKKFEKVYVSEEDLKDKKIPELEYNIQRYQYVPKGIVDAIFMAWGLATVGGWLDNGADKESKDSEGMMSIREFLERGKV